MDGTDDALALNGSDGEARWGRMRAFAPYAGLADVAGVPALTVRQGTDSASLPLRAQLIGLMGSGGLLLSLALTLEAAQPWRFTAPIARLAA